MTDVNHFEIVKQEAQILEVISKYLDTELRSIGTETYEPDDKTCPFCGHKDSFRINNQETPGYYNCFSCGASGDVISFVQKVLDIEKPYDAVKRIAKDFNIDLPKSKESPIQQIFNASADYYANLLQVDGNKYTFLEGLNPLDYQITVRKHDPEVLKSLGVGWSDGRLCSYLESLGFDSDLIEQSGLKSKKTKQDFLPEGSFIYPHIVNGKVSTFTFKNMSKGLAYQIRKENHLNNVMFLNQDSIKQHDQLVIVEGENDLISVIEGGWKEGVIATTGQISKDQIEYLSRAAAGKNIITAFDADEAGDKYRSKISSLSVDGPQSSIRVDHIKVPGEYKDIDKYIREGNTFDDALNKCIVRVMGGVEIEDGIIKHDGINVFEKDGRYFKVEVRNDEPVYKQISDFTIQLSHILVIDGRRSRIVRIRRWDGLTTSEVVITEKTKVNLRSFKECVAAYSDGTFSGSERDMDEMWRYILSVYGEELVELPKGVGQIKEGTFRGGWIFRNCFIDRYGKVHEPDDRGIFWPHGKRGNSHGIRAQSVSAEDDHDTKLDGIPILKVLKDEEEYSEIIAFFLQNLVSNFGSEVQGITTAGWCMANAFSGAIFDYYKFFPFLFLYGKFGGGKSNILKWLLAIYGMEKEGGTTVSSLRSGVGFERKLAYFHSLPLAIDEVRSDQETRANYGNFRKWFNREGRSLASMDSTSKIQQREVHANIVFGGEEIIEESATRSRILPIRLFRMDDPRRETKHTYEQLMEAMGSGDLSSIGLHWIRMSCMINPQEIFSGIKDLKTELKERAPEVSTRTLDIYAIIAYFGRILAEKFYRRDYDYVSDLIDMIRQDSQDQSTGEIVGVFLDMLDGVVSAPDTKITRECIFAREGKLYMWLPEIDRHMRRGMKELFDGNTLSRQAIKKALEEESYCLGETKTTPALSKNTRRNYLTFELKDAPESMKNIAEASIRLPN